MTLTSEEQDALRQKLKQAVRSTRHSTSRDQVLERLTPEEQAEVAAGTHVREILQRRSAAGLCRVPEYRCSICKDRGHLNGWGKPIREGIDLPLTAAFAGVPVDEIEFCTCQAGAEERAAYCKVVGVQDTARLERIFQESGVPPRLRGLSFQALAGDLGRGKGLAILAAKQLMRDEQLVPEQLAEVHPDVAKLMAGLPRMAEPRYGLVLYGDNGVGKSAIAAIIAEHMIRKGIATLFIDYTEFVKRIQAEYGKPDGNAEAVISTAIDVPFLVLDDMGSVSSGGNPTTSDRQEIVYRLINLRHQRRRWTVITTNLNEAQIEAQFSRRTYQRMRELCLIVKVGGLNLREQSIE